MHMSVKVTYNVQGVSKKKKKLVHQKENIDTFTHHSMYYISHLFKTIAYVYHV